MLVLVLDVISYSFVVFRGNLEVILFLEFYIDCSCIDSNFFFKFFLVGYIVYVFSSLLVLGILSWDFKNFSYYYFIILFKLFFS